METKKSEYVIKEVFNTTDGIDIKKLLKEVFANYCMSVLQNR